MKKVQFFLKFANFYCRFIKDYFKIVVLLHELIKDMKKKWKSFFALINIAKDAFNALKVKFINTLLFIHFNFNKQIHIELDASNIAITIIISQLMNNEF